MLFSARAATKATRIRERWSGSAGGGGDDDGWDDGSAAAAAADDDEDDDADGSDAVDDGAGVGANKMSSSPASTSLQ